MHNALPVPTGPLSPNTRAHGLGRLHLPILQHPQRDAIDDGGAHHVNLDKLRVPVDLVGRPRLVVVNVLVERRVRLGRVDLVVGLGDDAVGRHVLADRLGLVAEGAPEDGDGFEGAFFVAIVDGLWFVFFVAHDGYWVDWVV